MAFPPIGRNGERELLPRQFQNFKFQNVSRKMQVASSKTKEE